MAVKRAVKKAPPKGKKPDVLTPGDNTDAAKAKKAAWMKATPGRPTPPTGMPPTAAQAATPATPAAPAQGGFAERIAAFRAAMAKKKGKK